MTPQHALKVLRLGTAPSDAWTCSRRSTVSTMACGRSAASLHAGYTRKAPDRSDSAASRDRSSDDDPHPRRASPTAFREAGRRETALRQLGQRGSPLRRPCDVLGGARAHQRGELVPAPRGSRTGASCRPMATTFGSSWPQDVWSGPFTGSPPPASGVPTSVLALSAVRSAILHARRLHWLWQRHT